MAQNEIINDKYEKIMQQIAKWGSFYRENPNRFIEEYFGIKLKPFQEILMVEFFSSSNVFFLGCRGISKTWCTSLFASTKCVLYPGTACVVASATRKQAGELIGKIEKIFIPNYPMFALEVEEIAHNQYNTMVKFRNGSYIEVVTANQNARCGRANLLIIDEARLVDKNIIDSVLKKFLTASRHAGYMDLDKYSDLPMERNQEIYLTSGWYASHWCHTLFKDYAARMISEEDSDCFVAALPYQLSIKEKLLDKRQVEIDVNATDFNEVSFICEMCAEWWEGADSCLYAYDEIYPARNIKYPIVPSSISSLINDKRIKIPPKLSNEVRILSADIALMQSNGTKKNNDATSVVVNQMFYNDNDTRTIKNIVYTTNYEGLRAEEQALELRRLIAEFDADYCVIDARGLGLPIVDMLMADMYDSSSGATYHALGCCNNEDIAKRCKSKNAPKKIWAMLGSQDINSACALTLREEIKRGNIRLLESEENYDEIASELAGWGKLSLEDKLKLKAPYMNTTLMINELINLETEIRGNYVRIKEKSGFRKDRYSSLSYNIWLSNYLEKEHESKKEEKVFQDIVFQFRAPNIGV